MFEQESAMQLTFNTKLPKAFIDGLVDGSIQGWSQKADSVNIWLADEKLAQISCTDYREDLDGILPNPNASFFYELKEQDIKEEWRAFSSINLKVEFLVNGHIDNIVESQLIVATLAEQLGFSIQPFKPSFSFDGIMNNAVTGWCDNAGFVELYVDLDFLTKVECNIYREDLIGLVDNQECGFSYAVDAKVLKSYWFLKNTLQFKAIYKSKSGDALAESSMEISALGFLNGTRYSYGEPVEAIAQVIEESELWDEGYYLSQIDAAEVTHENKIIDFILKGVNNGKNPNPHFNSDYYLTTNPDVAQNGINPLYHYITIGETEGRHPVPYFNPRLYLDLNPDLQNWKAPLLLHFLLEGPQEYNGVFDYIYVKNGRVVVSGWAKLLKKSRKAPIEIKLANEIIAHGLAEKVRKDLIGVVSEDGANAFDITLPKGINKEQLGLISAHVSGVSPNNQLNMANLKIELEDKSNTINLVSTKVSEKKVNDSENKKDDKAFYNSFLDTLCNARKDLDRKYIESVLIDESEYMKMYPDVKKSGLSAVQHYFSHGVKEKKVLPRIKKTVKNIKKRGGNNYILYFSNAGNSDGSFKYRCVYQSAQYKKSLVYNGTTEIKKLIGSLFHSEKIIFSRPEKMDISIYIIQLAKNIGVAVEFDYDDLLLPEYADYLGHVRSKFSGSDAACNSLINKASYLHYADSFRCSTPLIEKYMAELGKPTTVYKNKLPSSMLIDEKMVVKRLDSISKRKVNIIYLSGTATHKKDYSIVHGVLIKLAQKYPEQFNLTFLGNVQQNVFPLELFVGVVKVIPRVDFSEMLEIISVNDIALVPLEDTIFNNGKSNIKFVECGSQGVPVIASPVDEFNASINHSKNGWTCYSQKEWFDLLEAIVTKKIDLLDVSLAARNSVENDFVIREAEKCIK